jgi:hypothetical protein
MIATCIHGAAWDGQGPFWCPDCFKAMLGAAGPFVFEVTTDVAWSAMSPRQVWDAIKRMQRALDAAPKVAGPWQRATGPSENGHTYEFRNRPLMGTAAWVGPDFYSWDEVRDEECVGFFDSREAADAALRARGWLLVDDADATTYGQDQPAPMGAALHGLNPPPLNHLILVGPDKKGSP